jgi:hypothetical protein
MPQRRRQKTRKGTRSYRKKSSRVQKKTRSHLARRGKTRARKQRGGAAHIPDDRFPEGSVVTVRDADGDESPFYAVSLEDAEKELIAASDRPADPYDEQTPGDEPGV